MDDSKFMIQFEDSFNGEEVSGYCPLLRVGQTRWIRGYYKGDDADILVEYSSERNNLLRTDQVGQDRWLCFRPTIRAIMFSVGPAIRVKIEDYSGQEIEALPHD